MAIKNEEQNIMTINEQISHYLENLKLYQKCFLISGVLFNVLIFFAKQLWEVLLFFWLFLVLISFIIYLTSIVYTIVYTIYPRDIQRRKYDFIALLILLTMSCIAFTPKDIFKGKIILSAYNKQDSPNGGAFWVNFRDDGTFEVNIVSFLGTGETFEGRYTMINNEITLLNKHPRLPKKFIIRNENLYWIEEIDGKEQESPSRYLIITKNEIDKP